MGKIPGTILKLQWSCQFLFPEWPQCEAGENQGRPTIQVFSSNAIDVYANKFQSTNKVIFTCAK